MSLKINTLTIKNFLSIGNVTQSINFSNNDLVLVLGENLDMGGNDSRNGVGKAQPLYSKIKTPTGWTTMGDIQVGDVVSTPNGKSSSVTNIFPQGLKETYRLHFSDGRTVDACKDHLWKIYSHQFNKIDDINNGKYRILTTSELIAHNEKYKDHKNKSTYYKYVPLIIPEITNDIDLPFDPYFLGAMIGDGYMTKSGIGFTTSDSEIFENMKCVLPPEVNMIKDLYNEYGYSFPDIKRTKIKKLRIDLENLDMMHTAGSKHIPEIYKKSSIQQKLRLLQGLVDTDGYASGGGSVSICTVSQQLAHDIQEIVWSIGGMATIHCKKNSGYKKNGLFIKCLPAYNVVIMYHTPKDLSSLTRKKDRLPDENYQYKNRKLRIDKIEYIGEIESKCIKIAHSDHLYITDNYVVTHNSSIVNALSYALYGTALTNIKRDNLINKTNSKNMFVTLDFEKDGINYRIERGRKPGIFRFIKNNISLSEDSKEDNDAQGENRHTQEEIERLINISHDMFKHILALNTYVEPFLSLKSNDQRVLIEQLLGITKLSEKAEKLKEEVKKVRDEIKDQEFQISAITEANKRINENIKTLEQRSTAWDINHQRVIDKLQDEIMTLMEVDISSEIVLHKQRKEIEELTREYNSLTKDLSIIEKEIRTYTKSVEQAEKNLLSTTENMCPVCDQEMESETHKKVHAEFEAQIKESKNKLTDRLTKKSELCNIIETVKTTIPPIPVTFYNTVEEAYNHKTTLDTVANSLEKELSNNNPYIEQIENLKSNGLQIIDFTKTNELVSTRDHMEFLQKLLTSKDSFIRKKIIDQNLTYLNHRLAYYLEKIGLPHLVKFKSDLEVEISLYGKEFDFDNLSRGERTRLILSLSWAFRDVYESLYSKINLLFIDELIDSGLDSSGVEGSLAILKKMTRESQRNIYLISHRDELIGRVTNVLKVIKEGGFSTLEMSDTQI